MGFHLLALVLGVVAIKVLALSLGSLWVWIDRRTNARVMNERINDGSDRFFEKEKERERSIVTGEDLPPVDDVRVRIPH
ncbi:MAG: hypothetical protein ACJ8AB_04810 [Gemmatimonadaceae bacterium]